MPKLLNLNDLSGKDEIGAALYAALWGELKEEESPEAKAAQDLFRWRLDFFTEGSGWTLV